MYFIGITGGVGAGKSALLSYLAAMEGVLVLRADDLAHELMEPGHDCYDRLLEAFADEGVFDADGRLLPEELGRKIFSDPAKRRHCNAIVHPAVRAEILERVRSARKEGSCRVFFLEAALLLEEHYDEVCDELWYIYASEQTRRERLARTRGYSDEKITALLASQLTEEVFRSRCQRIIDNDGKLWTAKEQLRDYVANLTAQDAARTKEKSR